MKSLVFILFAIVLSDSEIPLSPEVSSSYHGIKENHIFTYGNFSYQSQLVNRSLIHSDAIFFNNIISRNFNSSIPGDVNGDDIVNVIDIVVTINLILSGNEYFPSADQNSDGIVNVLDIVQLVNIILD
tara:strand:- start:160 stop:543 length:384 start_codon:yes stop_codon:yes gene_type:complete